MVVGARSDGLSIFVPADFCVHKQQTLEFTQNVFLAHNGLVKINQMPQPIWILLVIGCIHLWPYYPSYNDYSQHDIAPYHKEQAISNMTMVSVYFNGLNNH